VIDLEDENHLFDLNIEPPFEGVKHKHASQEVKNQVFHELLRISRNGVLPKNVTREVTSMFHVHI
jgi:hypothetical protein